MSDHESTEDKRSDLAYLREALDTKFETIDRMIELVRELDELRVSLEGGRDNAEGGTERVGRHRTRE